MEEGCWLSGVSKNGIVGAQGGPTLFGSHCTTRAAVHCVIYSKWGTGPCGESLNIEIVDTDFGLYSTTY